MFTLQSFEFDWVYGTKGQFSLLYQIINFIVIAHSTRTETTECIEHVTRVQKRSRNKVQRMVNKYNALEFSLTLSYLRLAIRLLLRPIPRHFSRCGAKREAAMLRLQLGHTHSLFFHWLYTWPNTSNPGWSTISGNLEQAVNYGKKNTHKKHTKLLLFYCVDVIVSLSYGLLYYRPS